MGLRYEKALAKALPGARHGQWFEFEDRNGLGFCQTDLLWELGTEALAVLEVKYTWTPSGHTQLEQLYRPVVERAMGLRMVGVVVCKNLVPGMPKEVRVTGDLERALALATSGARCALHWLGGVALKPRSGHLAPIRGIGPSAESLGL